MQLLPRIVYIASTFLLSLPIIAQGIVGGARMGLALSSLEASHDVQFSTRVGWNSGLLLQVASSDLFALQTEMCFVRHAGKGERKIFSVTDTTLQRFHLKLDYIEVPLLARFSIGETVRLSAYSGVLMGFLIGLQEQQSLAIRKNQQWQPVSSNKSRDRINYQDSNIGWIVGASAEYNNAFLEVRYATGFSDIYRTADWRLKIKTFYIGGGYVLYF